jgi:exo-beta-1,3-glucanase (GH17 family)
MKVIDALKKGSNWILYQPVTDRAGGPVDEQDIRTELQFLYDKGFRGVVTYAFDNGREKIPEIAKEIGFQQVIAGLWATNATYETEKANLTEARRSKIDGYVVGNETQLRGDVTPQDLVTRIREIRALSGKPTTTSDAWYLYRSNGCLHAGDWIFPNLHPFFDPGQRAHQDPTGGADFVKTKLVEHFTQMRDTDGKDVVLHEAWWPSAQDGNPTDSSYQGAGSPENQKRFFEALASAGVKFVYGEAFDQSWKKEGDTKMGGVGGHWGLWHDTETAKLVTDVINYGYRKGYQSPAPQNLLAMDTVFTDMAKQELGASLAHGQQPLGGVDAPQGAQRSLSQIAMAQVRSALGGYVQEHSIDAIKVDSTTTVGKDIQLDVTFEMRYKLRNPVSHRMTFVLSPSGKEYHGDSWTLTSLSQDTTGRFQFNEQSLNLMRGALKRIQE